MHRRVAAVAVVFAFGLVVAGCGSEDTGGTVVGPDSQPTKIQVKAAGFAFDPTAIPLTAGEDVQFVITNDDQVEHNLTVDGLGVNQDVEGGKTEEADTTTAVTAGTYAYRCEYHPDQMKGTVTVT